MSRVYLLLRLRNSRVSMILAAVSFSVANLSSSGSSHAQSLEAYYSPFCVATTQGCQSVSPETLPPDRRPKVSARSEIGTPLRSEGRFVSHYVVYNPDVVDYPTSFLYLRSEGQGLGAQCQQFSYPRPIGVNASTDRPTIWTEGAGIAYDCFGSIGATPIRGEWTFTDRFTFGAPIRRKAVDGSEFEASPLVQSREGRPWLTMYWGYKLGLVESQFDWNAAELSQLPAFANWPRYAPKSEEFVLLRLPPPIIEGTVTEYINTADYPTHPGGIYFYASTDEDRRILDAQLPGKFVRTGKSFKHGGYVSVCRFYGSASPGPNTHFYTANFDECEFIKSLEIKPRPLDRQQLNFEGKVFYANLPIPAATPTAQASCPAASIPLYRAYNAAFGPQGKRNYDSNHRFSTNRADIDEVVQKGWVDEGLVMCVPQ
jgi:Repeat of unknown function (DUF5648)